MITRKTVLALATLSMAVGVTVEMPQSSAQAEEWAPMTRPQAYAAARVDTAFDLVAALPETAPVMVPMAQKGDLLVPPGCSGLQSDAQSECMDVAYEIESVPSIVVETREGSTSTLMRLDPFTLAGVTSELPLQSE